LGFVNVSYYISFTSKSNSFHNIVLYIVMLSLVVAAACLVGSVFAQIPGYPSYSLVSTNTTLGVKYGKTNVVPGETLGFKGQPSLHAGILVID